MAKPNGGGGCISNRCSRKSIEELSVELRYIISSPFVIDRDEAKPPIRYNDWREYAKKVTVGDLLFPFYLPVASRCDVVWYRAIGFTPNPVVK